MTQAQVASWWITAGLTEEFASKSKVLDALAAREAGVVDAAGGAALVPLVAFGHYHLGEEPRYDSGALVVFS